MIRSMSWGFTVWAERPAACWGGLFNSKAMGSPSDGMFYGGGFTAHGGSDYDGARGGGVY